MPGQQRDTRAVWARNLGLFGVIVGDMIGYTGAGVALGWLAYKKCGAPSWILLPTSLSGLGLAFYQIYKRSIQSELLNKTEENHDKAGR